MNSTALNEVLLHHTISIGHDFDTYGGDVVMLIAAKERAEEDATRGMSRSTRSRVRCSVNLSLVEIRFGKMFGQVRDGEWRIRDLAKACAAMRRVHGRYWLADTLTDYYSDICPVDDPVSHVLELTRSATRVIAGYEEARAFN